MRSGDDPGEDNGSGHESQILAGPQSCNVWNAVHCMVWARGGGLPSSCARGRQWASRVALQGVNGVPSAILYRETGKGAEDRAQTPPSLSGKPEKGFLRRDSQSKSTEMAGDITKVRGTNVLNTAELR